MKKRLLQLVIAAITLVGLLNSCKKDGNDSPDDSAIISPKPYDPSSLEYYVDAVSGNDANVGKSAATAWKTIQKACDNATPGSTVFIKGGSPYSEQVRVNVAGTSDHPIFFQGYGPEDPVLDGTGQAGSVMLTLTNTSYLRISRLVIQNLTLNGAQGVAVTASANGNSTDLQFHHLTIRNINWTNQPNKIPGSNDNAQPFIVYGHGAAGANAVTNLVIDSSLIENNITGFSECLSLDGNISGFNLSENTVQNNSNIGIALIGNYRTSATASLDQARNGVVRRNTCLNNVSAYATSGGIYADGSKDLTISGNYCAGNGYGIEIGCEENGSASGIKVVANLLCLNQVAGLAIGGYNSKTTGQVTDCLVYNNSFFKNNSLADGTGELYISKASRCVLKNNLFFTTGQKNLFTADVISPQTDNLLDFNDWFSSSSDLHTGTVNWQGVIFTSFDSYRAATRQESNALLVDPMILNAGGNRPDLHLSASSPLHGKGDPSVLQADASLDFDGNPLSVNGKVSIGAYR